jgi:hypothetical protein
METVLAMELPVERKLVVGALSSAGVVLLRVPDTAGQHAALT